MRVSIPDRVLGIFRRGGDAGQMGIDIFIVSIPDRVLGIFRHRSLCLQV